MKTRAGKVTLGWSRTSMILGLLVGFFVAPTATWATALPNEDEWCDLGFDLAGTHGSPVLTGDGHLIGGSTMTLTVSNAYAESTSFFVIGLSTAYQQFAGGVMVPAPTLIVPMPTGGTAGSPSTFSFSIRLPNALPVGTEIYAQSWIVDPGGPQGYSSTTALRGTVRELFDVISEETDDLLEIADAPSLSKPIYDVQDFSTQTYVRSDNCWAASIDLTGLSPWNQTGANTRAGTLISPRHIAFAKHYSLSTTPGNNELVFVTKDNVTITRKLEAVLFPGDDIGIGVLDADVPPEIAFYPVLPRGWANRLPNVDRLPMLHLDQEEKALVRDMRTLAAVCNHAAPLDDLRKSFSETLIGGDSGNPAFLLIGGQAVLILTHFSAVHGPSYIAWFDEVNAAMASLGGGYQLTEFDLRGFARQ